MCLLILGGDLGSMETTVLIREIDEIVIPETRMLLSNVSDNKRDRRKAEKIVMRILRKALRNKALKNKSTITSEDVLAALVSERVKIKFDNIRSIRRAIDVYLQKVGEIIGNKTTQDLAVAIAYMKVKGLLRMI